jgi:hypothetical protein
MQAHTTSDTQPTYRRLLLSVTHTCNLTDPTTPGCATAAQDFARLDTSNSCPAGPGAPLHLGVQIKGESRHLEEAQRNQGGPIDADTRQRISGASWSLKLSWPASRQRCTMARCLPRRFPEEKARDSEEKSVHRERELLLIAAQVENVMPLIMPQQMASVVQWRRATTKRSRIVRRHLSPAGQATGAPERRGQTGGRRFDQGQAGSRP